MIDTDTGGGLREHEAAQVARIDAAAEHMLRRLRPIEFRLARTSAEREAAYRLRYRTVTERGWQPPVALENELECEAIDERAQHIVGWRGDRAIANLRIMYPKPGQRLPIEHLYGIEVPLAGEVVQVDRICIDRDASDRRGDLLLGLLCGSWQQIYRRGYRYVVGLDTAGMIRLYERIGLVPTVLGEARLYWGEARYPSFFQPLQVNERFFERIYADR